MLESERAKPGGAEMRTGPVKFEPRTLNVWLAEGVPTVVENAIMLVPPSVVVPVVPKAML